MTCKHPKLRVSRWVKKDSMLMFHEGCLYCSHTLDEGHVYGEDDGSWTKVYILNNPETQEKRVPWFEKVKNAFK